jgi:hypothetical protein
MFPPLVAGWTMFLERKIIGRIEGKAAFYFGASQVTFKQCTPIAPVYQIETGAFVLFVSMLRAGGLTGSQKFIYECRFMQ